MKKEGQQYKLCTNDIKIIRTVSILNEQNIYPLPECVHKILVGDESEEIERFNGLPTYKTLVSYKSKQVSRLIVMLVRYNYLERVYDIATDEMYLKVSIKGEMELNSYIKKHKQKYVKKKVKTKPLYIVIEKNWKF